MSDQNLVWSDIMSDQVFKNDIAHWVCNQCQVHTASHCKLTQQYKWFSKNFPSKSVINYAI